MMSMIDTERLSMRPMSESDAEAFARLRGDPPTMAGTTNGAIERAAAMNLLTGYVTQWLETGLGMWAVIDRGSGEFIGECGFARRPTLRELTLRYALARDWWGRGLASEAVNGALDFGFGQFGLDQVSAVALETNDRSCRILEGAGMTMAEQAFDGIDGFRRYHLTGDEWQARQEKVC